METTENNHALILFIRTLALYKSFTYLLTSGIDGHADGRTDRRHKNVIPPASLNSGVGIIIIIIIIMF